MAQKSNDQLRKTWRNRIDRQRQSGQTVIQFCQQEGVSTPSYYKWKRKLQAEQPAPQKKTTTRRKAKAPKRRPVKVAAPSTSPPFVQLPLPAPPSCPWIEVVLSEGTIVRLPQQNLAALKTVLGALGNNTQSPVMEELHHA
jgi:hypothetical protein